VSLCIIERRIIMIFSVTLPFGPTEVCLIFRRWTLLVGFCPTLSPNPISQPMHTHSHHAIAIWREIIPVSSEGAPPTACLPLDGVGGLRHGNLENTSFESLISDIRLCGTMQFLDYSFTLPSSSVISIFISDSFRTLDYPDG